MAAVLWVSVSSLDVDHIRVFLSECKQCTCGSEVANIMNTHVAEGPVRQATHFFVDQQCLKHG